MVDGSQILAQSLVAASKALPGRTVRSVDMPMRGRKLRIEGVREHNSPDEVGPPIVDAWLRYDTVPRRDDLRRALLAQGSRAQGS